MSDRCPHIWLWILWYTEEFIDGIVTKRCPGALAAKQAPLDHCAVDMRCLVFSKCDTVHYGQTSPLWSHLSKRYVRGLVVCSDKKLNIICCCCWGCMLINIKPVEDQIILFCYVLIYTTLSLYCCILFYIIYSLSIKSKIVPLCC